MSSLKRAARNILGGVRRPVVAGSRPEDVDEDFELALAELEDSAAATAPSAAAASGNGGVTDKCASEHQQSVAAGPELGSKLEGVRKLEATTQASGRETPRLRAEAARLGTIPFILRVPSRCKEALISSLQQGKQVTPQPALCKEADEESLVELAMAMRPLLPDDAAQLQRGIAGLLSAQSLFMRFMRPVDGLSSGEMRYLVDLDYFDRYAWGVSVTDPEVVAAGGVNPPLDSVGVAVCRYVRVQDPGVGNFGLVKSERTAAKAALRSVVGAGAALTPGVSASLKSLRSDHPSFSAASGAAPVSTPGAASSTAEMAVTVADALHQCGLGTLLMWALSQVALRHGISHFVGVAHDHNTKIRGLMASLGAAPKAGTAADGGGVKDTYIVEGMRYFVTHLPITLPPRCKALRRLVEPSRASLLAILNAIPHLGSAPAQGGGGLPPPDTPEAAPAPPVAAAPPVHRRRFTTSTVAVATILPQEGQT